jgi:DNA polymerase (family X)
LDAAAVRAQALSARELKQALADPGAAFDAAIAPRIAAMASDGPSVVATAEESRLPRDLAGLVRAMSVDLAPLAGEDLHVAADLAAAWHDRPAEDVAAILAGIREAQHRVPLGRALGAVEHLADAFGRTHAGLTFHPTGGLRRFEPTIGDVLVLVHGPQAGAAIAAWTATLNDDAVRARSAAAATFVWEGEEVTLRAVSDERFAGALLHYSGSRVHVGQLAARARTRGLRLTAAGLARDQAGPVPAASEAGIYEALELPWIPPERRHGLDEIALAERSGLGTPVTVADIQGDLHTHTMWSDGRDTSDTVVRSARALGYRYVAITDHSPSAKASRVLTIERLAEQAKEIAALRASYPGITILHGCEVDILADGSLDLPDQVMAGLDIVLASLHESHGHDGARLTDRYLRAMAHPLVNIVTHPANRAPGRTVGYELDWDRFFAAARDTGTAVEVDGAPGHLDLDGHLARRAVETGATVVVDSDGHFAERLGRQMRMGVGTAARGGVEARSVLNARGLDGVRAFVEAKRRRAR